MIGKAWRVALAALLACSALLVAAPAAPVRAHAQLVQAVPPAGAVLSTAPARVDLLFDDELDAEDSQIRVYDASGQRVDRRDRQVLGKRMTIGVRDVAPGSYLVQWQAAGDDGHKVTGSYNFQVGRAAGPGVPTLTLSPDSTNAGQTITVAGSSFSPNSTVLVTFGTDQQLLRTAPTDAQGRFSFQTLVPLSLAYGRQVFQALDTDLHLAAAALWVELGGWPPLAVQVTAAPEERGHAHSHGDVPAASSAQAQATTAGHESHMTVTIRLVNQSNFGLTRVRVAAQVPAGTRLLREGLEGPEDTRWRYEDGVLTWSGARVPAHTIAGPFTFTVDAAGLPNLAEMAPPTVNVSFVHTTPPEFSGTASFQPEATPSSGMPPAAGAAQPAVGTAPAQAPGGPPSSTQAPGAPQPAAAPQPTPAPQPGTRPTQP